MPLSAEALCWKKIIHGVTVAQRRERQRAGDRADVGLHEDRRHQEQAVEDRNAQHGALPAPVAPAAEREHDQHEAERHGHAGSEVEVGEPHADGDELGDQRDQVGQAEIARSEPAPQASVALEHQLAVAAVGDCADAHAHLLHHVGHHEQDRDHGHEEPDAILGAVGGVGDHARAVVLAEHREDPRPHEQPQQAPAPVVVASVVDARAVA
jgi:hypothetical protein